MLRKPGAGSRANFRPRPAHEDGGALAAPGNSDKAVAGVKGKGYAQTIADAALAKLQANLDAGALVVVAAEWAGRGWIGLRS